MTKPVRLQCSHADTCLPDYWGGHHLPHVAIVVVPGMSFRAIKSAIREELRQGAVMGSGDSARLLSADVVRPDEEKRADQLTRAAYAAVNRMKPANKGQRRFFTDVEQSDDDVSVMAYVVFSEIEPEPERPTVKTTEYSVCQDCMLHVAYGEGSDECAAAEARELEAARARPDVDSAHFTTGIEPTEDDPEGTGHEEFSRQDCELCGSALAGSRYGVTLLTYLKPARSA